MKFDMAQLDGDDLTELSALFVKFYDCAPTVYGRLQDVCIAEDLRRQRARRFGEKLADQAPVEIVLAVRSQGELRNALRHIGSHSMAAERSKEFPGVAAFLKAALGALGDIAAAEAPQVGQSIN